MKSSLSLQLSVVTSTSKNGMVQAVRSSSDYIQEDQAEVDKLSWDSDGVRYKTAFASWDQVLGVFKKGRRFYVLVPREPPHPPWLEVSELTREERERFESALQHQMDNTGYRASRRAAPPIPPERLLQLAIARQPIPGLVEIPFRSSLAPLWIGGALFTYLLAASFLRWAAVLVLLALGLLFLLTGAREALVRRRWFSSNKKRVLVLCPDGCVVGVRGGPKAFSWSEIGKFELENNAIVLRDRNGGQLVALQASYFGAPLSLVCAVAESYRERHQSTQGVRVAEPEQLGQEEYAGVHAQAQEEQR